MTPKTRPCRRDDCALPAMKGKQFCAWHWLARQPTAAQVEQARRRAARVPTDKRLARVPKASWPDGRRWCAGCQTLVPLFYCSGSRCRACASQAAHAARTEKTYGITADDYDRLLALQGGRCAICRCVPRSRRLAVDHDHASGVVRGLCCSRCNHDLLGAAHDDVEILQAAVAYLQTPPNSGRWQAPNVTKPGPLEEDAGPPPF